MLDRLVRPFACLCVFPVSYLTVIDLSLRSTAAIYYVIHIRLRCGARSKQTFCFFAVVYGSDIFGSLHDLYQICKIEALSTVNR